MSVPQIQASMETLAREDKEVGELVEVDDPKNITAEQQKKFQGDDGVQDYLALNQALKSMQGGESFREESLKEAALAYQAKLTSIVEESLDYRADSAVGLAEDLARRSPKLAKVLDGPRGNETLPVPPRVDGKEGDKFWHFVKGLFYAFPKGYNARGPKIWLEQIAPARQDLRAAIGADRRLSRAEFDGIQGQGETPKDRKKDREKRQKAALAVVVILTDLYPRYLELSKEEKAKPPEPPKEPEEPKEPGFIQKHPYLTMAGGVLALGGIAALALMAKRGWDVSKVAKKIAKDFVEQGADPNAAKAAARKVATEQAAKKKGVGATALDWLGLGGPIAAILFGKATLDPLTQKERLDKESTSGKVVRNGVDWTIKAIVARHIGKKIHGEAATRLTTDLIDRAASTGSERLLGQAYNLEKVVKTASKLGKVARFGSGLVASEGIGSFLNDGLDIVHEYYDLPTRGLDGLITEGATETAVDIGAYVLAAKLVAASPPAAVAAITFGGAYLGTKAYFDLLYGTPEEVKFYDEMFEQHIMGGSGRHFEYDQGGKGHLVDEDGDRALYPGDPIKFGKHALDDKGKAVKGDDGKLLTYEEKGFRDTLQRLLAIGDAKGDQVCLTALEAMQGRDEERLAKTLKDGTLPLKPDFRRRLDEEIDKLRKTITGEQPAVAESSSAPPAVSSSDENVRDTGRSRNGRVARDVKVKRASPTAESQWDD